MPAGLREEAKRALVNLLKELGERYGVTVNVTRDSPDGTVSRALHRVLLKAHPDKGGATADAQRLTAAKEAWCAARNKRPGRQPRANGATDAAGPPPPPPPLAVARLGAAAAETADPFRCQSLGLLLTYNGVSGFPQWRRFLAHVRGRLAQWGARHWCATLEASKQQTLHFHLMVQFRSAGDWNTRRFFFEGLKPNAAPNDLLGEGFSRRNMQLSLDRGFFYVWADKLGTQRDESGQECVAGNYEPCWAAAPFSYAVKGRWPENLWKAHKLSHGVYDRYLHLCREGVLAKRSAHKKVGAKLWKIPPKSPDLNPVERYWAWLRKKLRTMDLADAVKKRPVLSKVKYTARVKRVLKSKKSQQVAAACAKGLRKVCKEVVRNKGAETHG